MRVNYFVRFSGLDPARFSQTQTQGRTDALHQIYDLYDQGTYTVSVTVSVTEYLLINQWEVR